MRYVVQVQQSAQGLRAFLSLSDLLRGTAASLLGIRFLLGALMLLSKFVAAEVRIRSFVKIVGCAGVVLIGVKYVVDDSNAPNPKSSPGSESCSAPNLGLICVICLRHTGPVGMTCTRKLRVPYIFSILAATHLGFLSPFPEYSLA